jgi:hypothetical protein
VLCRSVDLLLQEIYNIKASKQRIASKKYIDERLPEEYEKCLVGLTAILREAGTTSNQTQDSKEKIQALSLAKECYYMKLDLLTNATVVKDAMRFVSEHNKKEEVKDISSVAAVAKEEIRTNQVF